MEAFKNEGVPPRNSLFDSFLFFFFFYLHAPQERPSAAALQHGETQAPSLYQAKAFNLSRSPARHGSGGEHKARTGNGAHGTRTRHLPLSARRHHGTAPPRPARPRQSPRGRNRWWAGLAESAHAAWRLDWLFRRQTGQWEGALQGRPEPIAELVPVPLGQFETVGAAARRGRRAAGERGGPGPRRPSHSTRNPAPSFPRVPLGIPPALLGLGALEALYKKRRISCS